MRDFVHVFVNMDSDYDGYITYDNFRKCLKSISKQKIHDLFWDNEKHDYKLMDIAEFLDCMKPKDFSINKEVVRT